MTNTAWAVIGAAYGDEGKGRTVDALVTLMQGDALVVRSNGGAQAGHTVVTPQGGRHVFHHIGSGALAGARTHLSRHFVHHPMTFMEERDRLHELGACVEVSADPRGYVTTPWDMMINQAIEAARGCARHGSCGYGFGETVGRNEESDFKLIFADLWSDRLRSKLISIRDIWLPQRFKALGIKPDDETNWAMKSDVILDRFVEDCALFADLVQERKDTSLGSERIIFEGAQGLMLDQHYRDFPHVTRSNTGIENMTSIALEAGIDTINAIYAMRCYLTRHGAGPMPDERDIADAFDVVDETNVPNPWQKQLRFGLIDPNLMADIIMSDIVKGAGINVQLMISVSCLDQAKDRIPYLNGQVVDHVHRENFADYLAKTVGVDAFGEAYGPTRADQFLPEFCKLAA